VEFPIAIPLTTTKQQQQQQQSSQPQPATRTLVTYYSVLPTVNVNDMMTYPKDDNNVIIPHYFKYNHNNNPQSIDTNPYLTTTTTTTSNPRDNIPLVFKYWLDYLTIFDAQNRNLSAQLKAPILLHKV